VVITSRVTPGWAIFVAILLLPIGLIVLIVLVAKNERTVTSLEDRSEVKLQGFFSFESRSRINATIRAASVTRTRSPRVQSA
jgi:hypothetical protein